MEMEMPKPVPMDRLKSILGGARQIMQKVESGDYQTGNVDARALTEDGVQGMMSEGIAPERFQARPAAAKPMASISPERIAQSKMPDAIKRAMLENPIPQATMGGSFALEDVMDFEKDEKPFNPRTPTPTRKPSPQPMNENRIQSMVGLNEAEVRTIVKDEIIEFLTKYFTKSLSEDVQSKVIKQLLESGKIKVKK